MSNKMSDPVLLSLQKALNLYMLIFLERHHMSFQARSRVEGRLQGILNMERRTGITIVGDGWSDQHRRPLLNFLACCPAGSRYIGSVDTTGEYGQQAWLLVERSLLCSMMLCGNMRSSNCRLLLFFF